MIEEILIEKKNQIEEKIIKEKIIGARNLTTFLTSILLLLAGMGFFLAGLSSYFNINLLLISDTSKIIFIPQGITMLFYGTGALGITFYLLLTIFWDVGSGYNEFSKEDNVVRIIRFGFPGKNREIFLSYDIKNIKTLKFYVKQGLNPRSNLLMVLKDKREIPLFPPQFFINPIELEKKAIFLSQFLSVPLESLKA
jgi:hypothetical protein